MCPACMTTAALIAAGASWATGLAALLIKNFGNTEAKRLASTMQTDGGENGSPANRITS
jgi:hypothetical protein